ncbi:ABC transporter permease [Symbiobacterium thermophilum]|uniref:Oligopeptide ABC transporter permease protein n=1 Tax=Symbiobacterium thermophilum (strain DSM 24528 / JCM 14929 / IAM 14863 / T) TaxID=292459 RepID=Q67T59_SYMTH|nr:ABC transporter permease [Symbiobacterium thermophilum]BAD39134.1 oligopeptide ABC transporter permease protein [Symbiobacterium thermophilum IAM 14863]
MAAPHLNVEAEEQLQGLAREESQFRQFARRFARNKLAVAGLVILVILYAVAIFAPFLASEPLDARVNLTERFLPPGSPGHPLGTDNLGRDLLSRMIWGSRISLSVGFVAMGVAVLLGTLVGSIAGYYGGTWIDIVLMRFAEAIDVIPVFFLLVTVVSVLEPSVYNIMIVIGLTSWPGLAYIVRGQFLSLRQRDFTEASRAMGATDMRLIFRHILPNAVAPIIVSATLRIGNAILSEAGLSFLGLGAPPPAVSWGQILSVSRTFLKQAPWLMFWPGLAIFVTVLAFNFVGDGIRDALDPKLKR